MKGLRLIVFAGALALGSSVEIARADVLGTVFTYQGQLRDEGVPANDEYDFIFRLFDDPAGGMQVGGDVEIDEWPVSDGLFTVELDFGTGVFTGDALWLEVSVRLSDGGGEYTVLSPRQPLNATPYALYALSCPGSGGFWAANGDDIYNTNSGFVGIGTMDPAAMLDVQSAEGTHGLMSSVPWIPVWAHRTGMSGTWPAIHGECDSEDPDGSAVRGIMTSSSSGVHSAGVLGVNNGSGYGVYGRSTGGSGVVGEADAEWSTGVRGINNGTEFGFGVYGVHYGSGWGVSGISFEDTGVHGLTHADWYGAGVHGHNNGIFGYGVHGTTDGGGIGVYGAVPSGTGVYGDSTDGTGVMGTTDSVSSGAMGIEGVVNSTSPGGYSAGVRGQNNGTGGNGIGVYGSQDGSGWGVYGYTPSGRGIYGHSGDGQGVYGRCDAIDWSGIGVYGTHAGYGVGVHGVSANGIGVYGTSTNGTYAGWFDGTVSVDVLEITGADVAEKFPVSDDLEDAQPGTVMEIDPENPGKLRVARGAYNRRVAGVVSGAGDIPAGTILGNMPGSEDYPPIALGGRVWVKCDATETPIELGDLLTTSDTPGHAMAVSDFGRAHGTVIGKAMTGLEEGTGLVLVLVNLQ